MSAHTHHALISVCTDCLLMLANGCDDCAHGFIHDCHLTRMSDSEITIGCGSDDCADCAGESSRFASSACDCCGDTLAGDRHCSVTWWSEPSAIADTDTPGHVTYPHEHGYLLDCVACESECHCTPGTAECVWSGHDTDDDDTETRTVRIPRGTAHLGSDAAWQMIAECEGRREISDACAVTVASWWQAPRGPAETFTRLVSHFAVTVAELLDAIRYERTMIGGYGKVADRDRLALDMLSTWCLNRHRAQVSA